MKKILTFFYFVISLHTVLAQIPQEDSLIKILSLTKADSVKVNALVRLSSFNQSSQQGLNYAMAALQLTIKIKYEKGEAAALEQIGDHYVRVNNYSRALYYFLEELKVSENIHDTNGISISNGSVGSINMYLGDFEKALMYYRKADAVNNNDFTRLAILHGYLGYVFMFLNKQDSALKYFQSSYEYFNVTNDKYQLDVTLNGLGNLQLAMGNKELALGYDREAEKYAIIYNDTAVLSYTYFNIAKYYMTTDQRDSSILYASRSLFCAQKVNALGNVIRAGKLLIKLDTSEGDKKTLQYFKIIQAASDSLNSLQQMTEIQNMSFNETVRQNQIAEKEKREAEERKQNIQYAAIFLGIIIFIILFLLLSRTIIVNERLISFLVILNLLVVFEFINLLIHPWLASFTHESPVLMLLALVIIASLLIPFHHRLEHWIKEKMVEKNKAIRLANAKKTIQQLEAKLGEKLE